MLRSVLSNAVFILVSDVTSRAASAVLVILIARELGESAAGVFTLSMNYVLILVAVALWGLDQLLIREVARDRDQSTRYLTHFLPIRIVVSLALWLMLAALLLALRPYAPQTNRFIALVGGIVLGTSVSNVGQSLLIALERAWLIALSSIIASAVLLGASIAAIAYHANMESLALILVCSSWIQAAIVTWMVRRYFRLEPVRFDLTFCRRQMGAGFPFVLIGLFIALEAQLGGILLSAYHAENVVGLFGMANVVISGLALMPQALRVGIFATMARLYRVDHEQFLLLYERAWRYLSLISLPMVVLLILLSEPIIGIIYQRSVPETGATLRWLAPTLFFYFLNIPNARLLIIDGRQTALARLLVTSTAANVLLGLVLIPHYGAQAAGMARVGSMAVLFGLICIYVERKVLAVQPWRLIWRPLGAVAIMILAVWATPSGWSYLARSLIGAAVYALAVLCLKIIPADEWLLLQRRLRLRNSSSGLGE